MLLSFENVLEGYLEDTKNEDVLAAHKDIAAARSFLKRGIDLILKRVMEEDEKAARKLLRYLSNVECLIRQRSVANDETGYIFADREVINRLIMPVLERCSICGETKQYAAGCRIRKDLDHIGIVEKSGLSCPYQF